MRNRFTSRGYLRAITYSVLAAFMVECCVNADEVREAYQAGRGEEVQTSMQSGTAEWLKVPQVISKVIGVLIRTVNE